MAPSWRGTALLAAASCLLAHCGIDDSGLAEPAGGAGGTTTTGGFGGGGFGGGGFGGGGFGGGGFGGGGGTGGGWPDGAAGSGGTNAGGAAGAGGTAGGGGLVDAGEDVDASLGGSAGGGTGGVAGADASDGSTGGTSGWKPSDITNCALWLDAADTSSLSLTGSAVQAWTDKCAATPVTSAGNAKPAFVPALLNGQGAVRFDAIDDVLEVGGTPQDASAYVLFFVAAHRSLAAPAAPFFSNRHLPGPAAGTVTYLGLSTQRVFLYQNLAAVPAAQGTKLLATQPHLVELSVGATGRELVVDGVVDATDTVIAKTSTRLPSGLLGMDTPNNWFGAIDLFEVVFYDRALTPAERGQVRAALKAKWTLP